tara:strand:+ start:4464 stop:4721 length:258 start_codon:yes stop_codon:yes gene_type:complete
MLIKKFLELKKLNRLAQKLRDARLKPYTTRVSMIDKKEHNRIIQGYKNIIDQKELEIDELKKQNTDLKKKLKEQKKLSKMLYESP